MTQSSSRQFTIGSNTVSDETDAYVIAEIGHNHQGDMAVARDMFHAAKMSGANAVKLQKRDNRTLYTKAAFDKPYENRNSYGLTYGEHREFLEFGHKEYVELGKLAAELELDFFATAFDFKSADFLAELDTPAFKIASGDLKTAPLIKYLAKIGKPIVLSTGGGDMEDVRRAADIVLNEGTALSILHCTATYPTEPADMNLRVIASLRDAFPETVIGLSDHYNGIVMAPVAYVLGARVFEKHFTLNHTSKGTDHAFSLEPIGMHKMVRDLQRTRIALGGSVKEAMEKEGAAIKKMGKGIYLNADFPAGHVIAADDISLKSPGAGIPPYDWDAVIGRSLGSDLPADHALQPEDLT